ncbi:GNAT family N-acetyltransferase [uncultured Alistipes sp.]|jgi:predicted acetyltransferase|uniref:GNAT family N-acetyltransferase n=1 Tax=uncultured Alistipes sp. TaxID=538949 RepID=UPI0025F5F958|nr:GNAT family N-acetyltransferase [uncultured Alistipes sp.]
MEKKHKLVHNTAEKCYEFDLGGQKAKIDYIKAPGFIVLTHTEVPEKYEGQGIGTELVCAVLEELRENEIKMIPQCGFVAHYIYRHPEWADVVLKEVPKK